MHSYVVRRLLLTVPTIVGVTLIAVVVMRALPGDIVDILAAQQGYTQQEKARLREDLGLNQSLPAYYGNWFSHLVRGDLGRSLRTNRSIAGELRERLPVTIELALVGLLLATIIAIPLGVLSAVHQNTWLDYVARSVAVFALAIPTFWLGTLVIVWGSKWFGWAPPLNYASPWDDPVKNLQQMWVPALLFGLVLTGLQTRMLRTTLLEVLRQDYIRTARSKGLPGTQVVMRHALRNGLLPFITVVGVQIPAVLGGAVVLELIFTLPGIGLYLLDGLSQRDYTVVLAVNVCIALIVILTNLVVDLSYAKLDPRIRLG
jgi:peptide/nickel transport system permease protein